MEYQEVSLTMLMVDGVVAVVMDEDEVDVIVVAVVDSMVVTESKTLAAMKRLQVVAKGEVGVWGEVEIFEPMDL
jgi:2-methylisocitrate lyase-like PEP mutase family enzyme